MTNELYNKIRAVVTVTLSAFIIGFLVWVWNDFNHRMVEFTCDSREVIVHEYDTIWGIVNANCSGNVSVAVDRMVEKYGTNIQVGQHIFLLANEDCDLRITDGGEVFQDC